MLMGTIAATFHAFNNYCTFGIVCVWTLLHSDLGQPSQTSDRGKNVKTFMNGPSVEEGNVGVKYVYYWQ
jgi:hypothetical protein